MNSDNLKAPDSLDGAKTFQYVLLAGKLKTGNTRHYVGGQLLEEVYGLAICQYEEGDGFYLFYCDDEWNVITDTFHDTIEGAWRQAEYEYIGTMNSWIEV